MGRRLEKGGKDVGCGGCNDILSEVQSLRFWLMLGKGKMPG